MLLSTLTVAALQVGVAVPPGAATPPQGPSPLLQKPVAPPATASIRGTCDTFAPTLCVALDATFSTVPFNSGFNCDRNDDGSAELMLNGWSFDFYGTSWSSVWANNNGNVSFGVPFSTYSSSGFPISNFPMVAPFWGDVDTGNGGGTDGVVWYREWSTAGGDSVNRLVITWDHVGFYDEDASLLNTFQLILTDGNDPLIGLGNNVCFCYDDMQWTTGDASGGSGGFGGTPATVGANQGNGTDFFLVGRFDQSGTAYDGPGGLNDGVDYLDGQKFAFSVASGSTNVPPVFVNSLAQHTVTVGQTLNFSVESIGPETGQTVTLTVDAQGLANFSSMETPGNPALSSATFTPDATQLGSHVVVFTATDDGTPIASADYAVEIVVEPQGIVGGTLCDPNAPNSTGRPGQLWATGSDVAGSNALVLEVADLPPSALGLVAVSQSTGVLTQFMGNAGSFCINGPDVGRYNAAVFNATADGRHTLPLDLTTVPTPSGVPAVALAGETWGWQLWYRDGMGTNFTNAVRVTLQ